MNKNQNTLIIGENGAGKSTILDALTFVLFNKPFRKINKPALLNSVNDKECVVELDFETGGKIYKVIRGIKPSIFEIYMDGTLINQESSSKDYQDYLEKFILKMNFKSFSQIVILGSAAFTPFMQLTPNDRRTIIEDLLDIQIFSTMNILIKQRLQTNKENLETNRIELIGKQDKKSFIEKTLKDLQVDSDDKRKFLLDKEFSISKSIHSCNNKIGLLENEKKILFNILENKDLELIKNKLKKLNELNTKILNNKSNSEKDIEFYSNNSTCSTCEQDIDEWFRQNKLSDSRRKILEFDEGLKDLSVSIQDTEDQINSVENIISELSRIENEIKFEKKNIELHEENLKDTKGRITDLNDSDNLLNLNKKELEKTNGEIDGLETLKQDFLNERLLIDTALNLLKDGGIKTKIIKQYLPIINTTINKYLSSMNFFVNFNIDENFEETIKSRYRDVFSYQNFSEGEKMKIDLALLLTWRHIAKMRNSCATNLLIMDEICDASMDLEGVDALMKILQGYGNANIFIISHRDQMHDKFKNVIKFKKVGNFSSIVES